MHRYTTLNQRRAAYPQPEPSRDAVGFWTYIAGICKASSTEQADMEQEDVKLCNQEESINLCNLTINTLASHSSF